MTTEVYPLHPHAAHHQVVGKTIVCLKSQTTQALLSREGMISMLMPLGSILLGLSIAALVNWCNTGQF